MLETIVIISDMSALRDRLQAEAEWLLYQLDGEHHFDADALALIVRWTETLERAVWLKRLSKTAGNDSEILMRYLAGIENDIC